MSTIKVTPEQLLHVSKQIEQGRQQLESIRNDLTARIGFIESQWAGATQERFFYDFQQSRPVLNRALESMVKSSQELVAIAERFQQADQEQVSLGTVAGLIPIKKMESNSNHNPDTPEYTMVYNTQFRKMMPTDKDGNVTPETLRAYERDTGSLDMKSAPDVEPEGEDIMQYQVNELKNGVYPFSGEPVSENRARVLITSLQASNMLMAFTGMFNRGYKVPKNGLKFSNQNLGIKQKQAPPVQPSSAGEGASVSSSHASEKLVLSDKARMLKEKGHHSQALDVHYEDTIRRKTGGKEVIYGEKGKERELDSVTSDAVIEAKRSTSAIHKPDNFLNKKMKKQLQATMQYAEENGLRVEYWFKYGVHPKIQKYLEDKGIVVKTGLGD
ncbi:WXG100 family type VII secretion target [Paenibacillus sp. JGP012]|uniref:WXG100 family type VII secretion target n=1 Tax=Paenibacillus sp. JGP012 TaxID=2735914 RepID=UPI00161A75C4|nr:WXG100 family type VII secretion target [Paenibacillus sp. JGP012]MBB6022932.1 WXG100 family type VII secretion target [Paenibacillus sp. JGP012]